MKLNLRQTGLSMYHECPISTSNMNVFIRSFSLRISSLFALATALSASTTPLADTTEMAKETRSTVMYLSTFHYDKKPLEEVDPTALIKSYISNLDTKRLFFLQSDVDGFQAQYNKDVLETDVQKLGSLDSAYAIFKKFQDNVHARVEWINKYLDGDLNLQTNDTYKPDRTEAAWPTTPAEQDKLWGQQIRFEIINEIVAAETREIEAATKKAEPAKADDQSATTDKSADKPATDKTAEAKAAAPAKPAVPKTAAEKLAAAKEAVRKRYSSSIESLDSYEAIDLQDVFLNTLAGEYDPHSNFFTENGIEEFDITMRNSLIGIGCILSDKDGFCLVSDLVPGGPAQKSGQINPGDKIIAVAQGTADFANVVGGKSRKAVKLIRGQEGTLVRLKIIPAGMTSEADAKIISLKREQVKLTTALAKAQIIEVPMADHTVSVGVINLPAFYGKGGEGDKYSTTDDVRELLLKLKAAGVQGIVLDLRDNGGGFLNEAIDMTGLFIPSSPVLQVRDAMGFIKKMENSDTKPIWDGPLMLLVNKNSASATEILTGALQDYRRALVVGDHTTHGKGTVQQMYYFSTFDPTEKGAAKVTIEKWYRPNGNSIQSKGVLADIALPSVIDYLPIGEVDEKNALPWDAVQSVPLTLTGDGPWRASLVNDDEVAKLRQESEARENSLTELTLIKQWVTWEKAHQEQKEFSLNLDARLAEQRKDIAFRDDLNTRLEALTKSDYKSTEILTDAAKEQLAENKATKKTPAPSPDDLANPDGADPADPTLNFVKDLHDDQLRESLRIMGDWLQLTPGQNPAAPAIAKVATAAISNAESAAAAH